MAEAFIPVDQFSVDEFKCPVCLDLLKDPVTTPCGHSYCKVCINGHWDQEGRGGIFSCPQCKKTFTPRLDLCINIKLAAVVEKLKKTELQTASSAHCYTKPGETEQSEEQGRAEAAVQKNELISSIEKKRSEVMKLIRDQESKLSLAEQLIQQLEQEVTELMRIVDEQEQLSQSHDHVHFLQDLSFDGVNRSLSDLKKRVMEFCEEKLNKIHRDHLQYFRELSLDPNTAHGKLVLSEKDKMVTLVCNDQQYSDHPERFDLYAQVLCKEELSGRCYWEVEKSGNVFISVSYKEISRKEQGDKYVFGYNNQSWSLYCASSSLRFYHNNIKTELEGPPASRIGVYVDHSAGTLSFYSISDTMRLLHTVQTTFTQPLYAGFYLLVLESSVRFCEHHE